MEMRMLAIALVCELEAGRSRPVTFTWNRRSFTEICTIIDYKMRSRTERPLRIYWNADMIAYYP